jgi:hypothetical protein
MELEGEDDISIAGVKFSIHSKNSSSTVHLTAGSNYQMVAGIVSELGIWKKVSFKMNI